MEHARPRRPIVVSGRPQGKSIAARLMAALAFASAATDGAAQQLGFPSLGNSSGRFGPYAPHQSTRERARRIGGTTWAAFKNADRARRCLPMVEVL